MYYDDEPFTPKASRIERTDSSHRFPRPFQDKDGSLQSRSRSQTLSGDVRIAEAMESRDSNSSHRGSKDYGSSLSNSPRVSSSTGSGGSGGSLSIGISPHPDMMMDVCLLPQRFPKSGPGVISISISDDISSDDAILMTRNQILSPSTGRTDTLIGESDPGPRNELSTEKISQLHERILQLLQDKKKKELSMSIQQFLELIRSQSRATTVESLYPILSSLLHAPDSNIIGSGWRCLRAITTSEEIIDSFFQMQGGIVLLRSLYKDKLFVWERVQALKWIRKVIQISPELIPSSVISCLVSIASDAQDTFRRIALETLRLYIPFRPTYSVFVTLLQESMSPGNQDIIEPILLTLLTLLQQKSNRRILHYQGELSLILSPYTAEEVVNETQKPATWFCTQTALKTIMKHRSGILLFAAYPTGFSSMVDLLKLSLSPMLHLHLIEVFSEIIGLSGKQTSRFLIPCLKENTKYTITGIYLSTIVLLFYHSGLYEALSHLICHTENERVSLQATNLLKELVQIGSFFLPPQCLLNLHSLPTLVNAAFPQSNIAPSSLAEPSLQLLDSAPNVASLRSETVHASYTTENQVMVHAVQTAYEITVSENGHPLQFFFSCSSVGRFITNSNLLKEKKFELWNWNSICEVMHFCIQKKEYFQTKFFKRLLDFLITFPLALPTQTFSSKTPSLAILLSLFKDLVLQQHDLETLVLRSVFVEELVNDLKAVLENKDPNIFSVINIQRCRVQPYLAILAQFLRIPRFYDDTQFIARIKSMIRSSRCDYITILFFQHICFSKEPVVVSLIKEGLDHGSSSLRISILDVLRSVIRDNPVGFEIWAIPLLLNQIKKDELIIQIVLSVIYESFSLPGCLSFIISKQPSILNHVQSYPLLLSMLSEEEGVKWLHETGWISETLTLWREQRNREYPNLVEQSVVEGLQESSRCLEHAPPGVTSISLPLPPEIALQQIRGKMLPLKWLYNTPFRVEIALLHRGEPKTLLTTLTYFHFYHISTNLDNLGSTLSDDVRVHVSILNAQALNCPAAVIPGAELRAILFLGSNVLTPQSLFVSLEMKYTTENILSLFKEPSFSFRLTSPTLRKFVLQAGQENNDTFTCFEPSSPMIWEFILSHDSNVFSQDGGMIHKIPSLQSLEFHLNFFPSALREAILPPHLYGALSQTQRGCEILQEEGCLQQIMQKATESDIPSIWTVGHVISQSLGSALFDSTIVSKICHDAVFSPSLTLRGVCHLVVNLMVHNSSIWDTLEEEGWSIVENSLLLLAVPKELDKYFRIYDSEPASDASDKVDLEPLPHYHASHPRFDDLLKYCSGLSIQLCQKKCLGSLTRLKKDCPELFTSPEVFKEIFGFISDHNLPLVQRRIVFQLFDDSIANSFF